MNVLTEIRAILSMRRKTNEAIGSSGGMRSEMHNNL